MDKESKYGKNISGNSLSRRSLLQLGILTGMCLIQANPILDGPSHAKSPSTPADDRPQYGGTLAYRLAADPPHLDMISSPTYLTQNAMAPVYNNLVMYDPMKPNKVVGELAEKWEVSPEGKIYTFSLMKGVKFHDGKPFTSSDVKFTYDLVRNPPKDMVSPRQLSLDAVENIETPDDYTVRFILKRPSPSLINILASGWLPVLPKHVYVDKGDMKKDAIGTGPFKFKSYTRGVSIDLVRNPDYFIKERPYLDGIKFFIIPDQATAIANLRTGQLHFYMMAGDDARDVDKSYGEKVVIQRSPFLLFYTLNFNSKRKPWDDIRIRQAVSLAIDRTEAVKVIALGEGDTGGLMPPFGNWALPPEELEKIPGYGKDAEANIAAAKKLLAEAGYPNGFSTTLLTRKGTDFEPLSVFIKDQLIKIGIESKLDVQETAKAYDNLNKRAFDLAPLFLGVAVDDPDAIFGEFYTCGAGRNYSDICSQEVDALYVRQSQTVDSVERKKLVAQMEKACLLSYSKIMLYWARRFTGLSSMIRNYMVHPSLYNNQRFQDVWFAKK